MGKLTDEINREETLTEEKQDELFYSMLKGKTMEDAIETKRGKFKVKYPKQKDIIAIGRIAAMLRGGIPASHFDAASEYEIQKCATLDVMISKGPAWYESAKKTNGNFSWKDVPDAHFVDEVYAKALQFRQEIQEQLEGAQKNVLAGTDEEVSVGVPDAVEDGLFSGVSSASGAES